MTLSPADRSGFSDPIVTGEAVAVELRPAGVGSRGVAFIIDLAAQLGLWIVVALIAGPVASTLESAAAAAVLLALVVAIILGYPVAFETLMHGRTPGKAAMGLRVVRDDGGPITFRHAFVRGLVGVVVDRPGLSAGVLAVIPMLASVRSKRMGDFAAGTVVVQERVPAAVVMPAPMPPHLAAWAAGLDLSGLGDDLALDIRGYLGRFRDLAPWARAELEQRLVTTATARVAAIPPGVATVDYLAAIIAERRRRQLADNAPPPPPGLQPPPPPNAPPPPPRQSGFAPPG